MLRFATIVMVTIGLMSSAVWAADSEASSGLAQYYYVVELEIANPENLDDPVNIDILGQHVGHLRSLYDRGVLVMAGPFDEGGEEGLAVVTAGSAEEAYSYFENDPSVVAGLMLIEDVHHWWTPFNRPENKTFSVEEFRAMMASRPPKDTSASSSADDLDEAGDMDEDDGEDMDDGDEMDDEGEGMMTDGALVHFELPSADFSKVQGFYNQLFGWEFMPMGDAYLLYSTPGGEGGGFTKDMPPGSGALFYIYASDVPSKLKDIVAAGGKVFLDTIPVPGYGWVAVFEDLEGNKVGLFSGENPPPGESPVPEM